MDKVRGLRLTLPRSLLSGLDRVARERLVTRARLLREAVAEFLKRCEAERVPREMVAYVEDMAEHSGDFVRETDAHTVDRLLRDTW